MTGFNFGEHNSNDITMRSWARTGVKGQLDGAKIMGLRPAPLVYGLRVEPGMKAIHKAFSVLRTQ